MSVLKAYKFLVTVPSTSRLFSISHTRTSSTPGDGKRWETQEDRRQFKIQTDFEYRKRRHEQRAAYNRKWYARPENHARHRAKQREARANRRVRSPYLGPMSYGWAQWLRRYAWVRDELDWRSHVPVYSPVRIERNCERCNFPSSTGAMLWWQRKYDPNLYDCTRCFSGDDPLKALPRGCEGVKTIAELRARKEALDRGAKPESLSQPDLPTVEDSKP